MWRPSPDNRRNAGPLRCCWFRLASVRTRPISIDGICYAFDSAKASVYAASQPCPYHLFSL